MYAARLGGTPNPPACGRLRVSHPNHPSTEWANRHRRALTIRLTHEVPPPTGSSYPLLKACSGVPTPHDFEARFICLIAGRLEFLAGEIAHSQTAWVNWNYRTIRSPQHEPAGAGTADDKPDRRPPSMTILCRGYHHVPLASEDYSLGSAHHVRHPASAGAACRTLCQPEQCVSLLAVNDQQTSAGCRKRG